MGSICLIGILLFGLHQPDTSLNLGADLAAGFLVFLSDVPFLRQTHRHLAVFSPVPLS